MSEHSFSRSLSLTLAPPTPVFNFPVGGYVEERYYYLFFFFNELNYILISCELNKNTSKEKVG